MPEHTLDALSNRLVELIHLGLPLPEDTVSLWWAATSQYAHSCAVRWSTDSPGLQAREIAQDATASLHPRFPLALVTVRSRFSTYLYTVTRNVFYDALRTAIEDRQNYGGSPEELLGDVESGDPDSERLTVIRMLLRPVMERLSAEEHVILRQVTKELTVDEAVQQSADGRANFFRRKEKLLRKLRRLLDDCRLLIR